MSNQGRSDGDDAGPLAELRAGDYDRFLQVLLARSAERPALLALFLLNLELARIPDAVREPMAGLIRLQWWRDALLAARTGRSHPALAFLAATDLQERVAHEDLAALVDARERELDATPIADVAGLEAYAGATAGALNGLAARVLGAPAEVVDQAVAAGTAYGVVGILRALPFALGRAAGPFRASVPGELAPLVRRAAARAGEILRDAGPLRGRRYAPALVLGLIARQDMARLTRAGFDLFDGRLAERPPWTLARCLVAARLGRY